MANIVEYRAEGRVKGTGNTTFISDGTPPMTGQYTDPSRNRVVHSSDYVAYGGGTRTNVAYIKQAWMANEERTLYISRTGRAQRYIGWNDTPANAPWYLDPWAWANGKALNAGENPQPKNIVSESNAGGEEDDNHDPGSSPVVSPMPTPTPTDGTPNCPDCTSDCSSPCSCTNSGTCGGTVTDNTPDCSYCTDGCSSCPSSDPPPSAPSTPPSTPSTPTTVACGGASYTGCTDSVSSRTERHVPSCSNCGKSYWTCSPNASRHTDVLTCKRSGCDASLTRCQNGPNQCTNGRYHWL